MTIELTEAAAEQLREVIETQGLEEEGLLLRVGVEGFGGQRRYSLELSRHVEDEDRIFESRGIRIACLGDALPRLAGTRIDFRDVAEGRGFVFERRPRERDPSVEDTTDASAQPLNEETVQNALREVVDPEVGINVVDLGLIYGIDIQNGVVRVRMTMTTPTCPMSEQIQRDAEERVLASSSAVSVVDIELVWDPPWRPEMISEEAKRALGWRV